jgi:hypothetical protein
VCKARAGKRAGAATGERDTGWQKQRRAPRPRRAGSSLHSRGVGAPQQPEWETEGDYKLESHQGDPKVCNGPEPPWEPTVDADLQIISAN